LPVNKNYRAQTTSPILPYTHKYENTLQELTLCINSDADSCSRLYRYYFSNVIKLCLNTETELQNILEPLSNVLNLNNVQQLELSYPIQLNSIVLSNLLPHLPKLTTLYVWYKMTNDFTFLNSIKNKSLLKNLEIRVLKKRDFQTILEILENNSYPLLLKICVEEEKFEEKSRQFIANWLKEQIHLTSGNEEASAVNFNVRSVNEIHSWITIQFGDNCDFV